MGCFLGCFGFSKKRKRRKPANKLSLVGDQKHGSYQPLDSCVSTKLDTTGSDSEYNREKKPKEQLRDKIRKKVSFNLNVQTYEPIPPEVFSESEGEERKQETAKGTESMKSYPSNYRYRNCYDSYEEEEDEIVSDESDLDDYDDDSDIDNQNISEEEEEEEEEEQNPIDGRRNRSQYVQSVLNPVENTSQWKAVKARREKPPSKECSSSSRSKENIAIEEDPKTPTFDTFSLSFTPKFLNQSTKPLLHESAAVDASLSNWVYSSAEMTWVT